MQVLKRSGPIIDISGTQFKVFAKSLNRKIYFGSPGFFSNSWRTNNIYKFLPFFDDEYPTFESAEVCMEAKFLKFEEIYWKSGYRLFHGQLWENIR